ncbi:hypothetical protein RJ641_017331 [Dillenia turbinata]|uniref:Uncharacterized protein n=1 Tax=Dillenia turbinata TaxID=194707 RepID=A0AAN8UQZ7_9MAGN
MQRSPDSSTYDLITKELDRSHSVSFSSESESPRNSVKAMNKTIHQNNLNQSFTCWKIKFKIEGGDKDEKNINRVDRGDPIYNMWNPDWQCCIIYNAIFYCSKTKTLLCSRAFI